MICYVLSHTHINFIITTQTSQNHIFADVSMYLCIDIEVCHLCFALPCECVPIDIMMKEGKGELKHFKNCAISLRNNYNLNIPAVANTLSKRHREIRQKEFIC